MKIRRITLDESLELLDRSLKEGFRLRERVFLETFKIAKRIARFFREESVVNSARFDDGKFLADG